MRLLEGHRRRKELLDEDEVAVQALESKTGNVEARVLALETEARLMTRELGGQDGPRKPA